MTEPLISRQEVAILNAARTVLGDVERRTRDSDQGDESDRGRLAGIAHTAEHLTFTVLNVAQSYCGVEMSKAEIHNGYDGGPAPLPEWEARTPFTPRAAAVCALALTMYAVEAADPSRALEALEALYPNPANPWDELIRNGREQRMLTIGAAAMAAADTFTCQHGYTDGCPDCDVPAHLEPVLTLAEPADDGNGAA